MGREVSLETPSTVNSPNQVNYALRGSQTLGASWTPNGGHFPVPKTRPFSGHRKSRNEIERTVCSISFLLFRCPVSGRENGVAYRPRFLGQKMALEFAPQGTTGPSPPALVEDLRFIPTGVFGATGEWQPV